MSEVTRWFDGDPPQAGWWDTLKDRRSPVLRLWWNGGAWVASPNSPSHRWHSAIRFHQSRRWRGLATSPRDKEST